MHAKKMNVHNQKKLHATKKNARTQPKKLPSGVLCHLKNKAGVGKLGKFTCRPGVKDLSGTIRGTHVLLFELLYYYETRL